MTSEDDKPALVFHALPGPVSDRMAAYRTVLGGLLDLIGLEAPPADEPGGRRTWHHRARHLIRAAVSARAEEIPAAGLVPEEWFEPLMRAAVHEPDPSFVAHLVRPAIAAYGRRRVQTALIEYLDSDNPADIAGAARGWYAALGSVRDREAESDKLDDLYERYRQTALRRFVAIDDLHLRQCILPSIHLRAEHYPADMRELVARAVQIARNSDDEYLRHRVEIQVR